jgi:F-type H+-transporting ATPase subunit delta
MSNIPVARRYARALLDAAGTNADVVLEQLEQLSAFFDGQKELFSAMASPALTRTQRTALTDAVIHAIPGMHATVVNLLKLMTDRNRFSTLPFITRQFRDLVDARQGRLRGRVTSATKLGDGQVAAIKTSLEGITKKSVVLELKVDPALIGGVVAQVGSKQYDGSLRNQLNEMAQSLSRPVR